MNFCEGIKKLHMLRLFVASAVTCYCPTNIIGPCFPISRLFYVYIKAVCMLVFFRLHFKQPHGGLLLSANDASYVYVITVLKRAAEIRCNIQ